MKNVFASENIDNGKSILGAPSKLDKKEIKNPRTKMGNTQKPKQKSSISVITMVQLDILDLIVTSD